MSDYLADAIDHAGAADEATFGSPAYLAHLTAATALAGLAVAEALRTLPQGTEHVTGETTGIRAPSPSPAEPEPGWECPACRYQGPQALTESSLVLLDQTEEAITALIEWRKVDRTYPPEAPEAWPALLRLRDVADRLGLAR